jgi:hypothetical protein
MRKYYGVERKLKKGRYEKCVKELRERNKDEMEEVNEKILYNDKVEKKKMLIKMMIDKLW